MATISHPTPDDSNFRDGIQKDAFSLTAGQVAWYHSMALTRFPVTIRHNNGG